MDRRSLHVELLEFPGEPISHCLGAGEHDRALGRLGDAGGDLRLVHLVHGDEPVGHLLDGDLLGHDLVHGRIGLVPLDQVLTTPSSVAENNSVW